MIRIEVMDKKSREIKEGHEMHMTILEYSQWLYRAIRRGYESEEWLNGTVYVYGGDGTNNFIVHDEQKTN